MAINLKILDYSGKATRRTFDVDIEDVALAWVEVWTGDEEISLITKSGERLFVSEYHAMHRFFDDVYDIIKNGSWVVDEEDWNERKGSDWHMEKRFEFEELCGDE